MQNYKLFLERLEAVCAKYFEAKTLEQALDFAFNILLEKNVCENLLDSSQEFKQKSLAAPEAKLNKLLIEKCAKHNIQLIQGKLKNYVAGIDMSIVNALCAQANTGSVLVNTSDENVLLATALAEVSIILLPKKDILDNQQALAPILETNLQNNSNLTLITGPSRTADIERVLTLGAHGPLALYVLIIEEDYARI